MTTEVLKQALVGLEQSLEIFREWQQSIKNTGPYIAPIDIALMAANRSLPNTIGQVRNAIAQADQPVVVPQDVEFLMHGKNMAFKVGRQMFTLLYEPDNSEEFEFMKTALLHALSVITPSVNVTFLAKMDQANTKSAIDQAVDRFLGWKLPDDFAPDCGIGFTPLGHPNGWPIGTNLFTAVQAKQMLEYMLSASPSPAPAVQDAELLQMAKEARKRAEARSGEDIDQWAKDLVDSVHAVQDAAKPIRLQDLPRVKDISDTDPNWVDPPAFFDCTAQDAAKPETQGERAELKAMTAHRASYFMERFKREEKLLGPNEQAAIDYVIALLSAGPAPVKREGLTEEQAFAISAPIFAGGNRHPRAELELVRAIEAAHGIGGEGS